MRYFLIDLAIGVFLTALLLIVFFKAGKRPHKQRQADRQLVLNFGDEGLIHLYDQADSDNERQGILEFVKEKLSTQEISGNSYTDMMPVLPPENAALPKQPLGQMPVNEQPLGQMPVNEQPLGQMPVNKHLIAQMRVNEQLIDQLHSYEQPPASESYRQQITGLVVDSGAPPAENSPAYSADAQMREIPFGQIDWGMVEEAKKRKDEEDARMMAHNRLIQDVFSKIQRVQDKVSAEQWEEKP